MTRWFFALCLTLLLPGAVPAQSTSGTREPAELRFGIYPLYDAKSMLRIFNPVAQAISARTGLPVRIVSAPDRVEFKKRALEGSYDILWPNNSIYLELRTRGLVRVVARGEPDFHGIAVVRADSGYRSVADLKGASVIATGPESLAGYLFFARILADAGMDIAGDTNLSFAGKVESIPFLVDSGKYDVGVYVEDLFRHSAAHDATFARLRIIARSPAIPQYPFIVVTRLPPDTAVAVAEALATFDGSTLQERAVLDELRLTRIVPATDAMYDDFERFYRTMQHP